MPKCYIFRCQKKRALGLHFMIFGRNANIVIFDLFIFIFGRDEQNCAVCRVGRFYPARQMTIVGWVGPHGQFWNL